MVSANIPDLFAASSFKPTPAQRRLEAQFAAFHRANPRVYELFDHFTRMLIKRGYPNHSSDAVLHRIRWATNVDTRDPSGEEFKINNNYTAYYARLWMKNNPLHDGFFRLRELRNEFMKGEKP